VLTSLACTDMASEHTQYTYTSIKPTDESES